MRGRRPACWKGLAKGLKSYGFHIFRINEYRTSKVCCNCHQMNSKGESNLNFFRGKRIVKGKVKKVLIYSLLKCTMCDSIKQRDINGVCNMHYKTMLILDGKENLIDKVFHIPENRLEQLAQSSHTWAYDNNNTPKELFY